MHCTSHESYLQNVVAMYEEERSGLELENVGPTILKTASPLMTHWSPAVLDCRGFSHDVTKIQTTKLVILLIYYSNDV